MESAEVLADVAADVADGTELEAQVEIRQLKEFEVFDALRLSMEVLVLFSPDITSRDSLSSTFYPTSNSDS